MSTLAQKYCFFNFIRNVTCLFLFLTALPQHVHSKEQKIASAAELIQFQKTVTEMGEMQEGEEKTAIFKCRNVSKKNILVTDIKTECSCTIIKEKSFRIQPGKTKDIQITFNSAGKNGHQNRVIVVHYEDGSKKHELRLYIKANVVNKFGFIANPRICNLGEVKAGEPFSSSISLTWHTKEDGQSCQMLVHYPEWISGMVVPCGESQNQWQLKIQGTIPHVSGKINDCIYISHDKKHDAKYAIPVTCDVEGKICISPKSLIKVVTEQEDECRASFVLSTATRNKLKFIEGKVESERECKFDISSSPSDDLSELQITIDIRFDDPYKGKRVCKGYLVVHVEIENTEIETARVPFLFMKAGTGKH